MPNTLLHYVQIATSSFDVDINSISDLDETYKAALLAREVFNEMLDSSDHNIPYFQELRQLDAVSDLTRPTKLKLPDNALHVIDFPNTIDGQKVIRYDVSQSGDTKISWKDIVYLDPYRFMQLVLSRDSSASNVITQKNDNDVDMYIYNDKAPDFWTTFDDQYIYFDSYDSVVDLTLQQSKTQIYVQIRLSFEITDNAIIPLPPNLEALFQRELKAAVASEIYKQPDAKSEQKAQVLRARARIKNRLTNKKRRVNYGRTR